MVDAYFSATKIKWILDQDPTLRDLAYKGELAFGTVDSWLIWNLTGGANHVTDATNASRTMIYNIHENQWDQELLDLLDIPKALLPKVVNSSEIVGTTDPSILGHPSILPGSPEISKLHCLVNCVFSREMLKILTVRVVFVL